MSIELMALVLRAPAPTNLLQRMTLLVLADYANDHDKAWPSMVTLADRIKCTPRAARLAIRALEIDGFLKTTIGGFEPSTGAKISNRYLIIRPALTRNKVPPHPGT